MKNLNIAIIGSGPAGLMTAFLLRQDNQQITIFEAHNRLGGKLPIAGGGRCNFSHSCTEHEFLRHYGDNGSFLKFAFKALNKQKTLELFQGLKIDSYVDNDGKIFPQSNSGKDIVKKFQNALQNSKVNFVLNTKIVDIRYQKHWILSDGEQNWKFDCLVIATGGFHSHCQNINRQFWQSLNLEEIPIKPALTAINVKENHQSIAGITIKNVQLFTTLKHHKKSYVGDLLITHHAYSGPVVQNISRYYQAQQKFYINWLNQDWKEIDNKLQELAKENPKQQLKTALHVFPLPKALIQYILLSQKIKGECRMAEMDKKTRENTAKALCSFPMNEPKTIDFPQAMTAAGGLSLKEINSKTMAVKKYEGLYVVGEALDIDGDCGGFNIQAALSTGYLAAQNIKKKYRQ